ncbi:hypothetical protein C0583_06970 [Candidatus Parcubacteria bacterium]|nr:MAG: hypothetical protein C0583_06970 [Candidatus Parcubacteria bacterium]
MKRVIKKNGFTYVEILLAVSIMAILLSISIPSYSAMHNRIAVKNDVYLISSALRNAQNDSLVSKYGLKHGLYFHADSYSVFSGDWSSPYQKKDYQLSGGASIISGADSSIVFERLTGEANSHYIIILSNNGDQYKISVSSKGQIETEKL